MPAEDFVAWAARSRHGFVAARVRSGMLPAADAEAEAARLQATLLYDGPSTPGHHIWVVRAGDHRIGHLWVQIRGVAGGREAYVVDVELDPDARGLGLGRATMLAAEEAARELGATRVRLTVLSSNLPAVRLYEGLGFAVVESVMCRRLDGPPTPYDAGAGVSLVRRPQVNPGHDVWTAVAGETETGSVCVHLTARSDGAHADGHGLRVRGAEHADSLLAACVAHSRDRGAVALALSVTDQDLVRSCLRAGFEVAAEVREKPLAGPATPGAPEASLRGSGSGARYPAAR